MINLVCHDKVCIRYWLENIVRWFLFIFIIIIAIIQKRNVRTKSFNSQKLGPKIWMNSKQRELFILVENSLAKTWFLVWNTMTNNLIMSMLFEIKVIKSLGVILYLYLVNVKSSHRNKQRFVNKIQGQTQLHWKPYSIFHQNSCISSFLGISILFHHNNEMLLNYEPIVIYYSFLFSTVLNYRSISKEVGHKIQIYSYKVLELSCLIA